MNNFIFENSTKVFFGKGCVKEYLCCLTKAYGDTVMLCYGGGSIKKNGIYDEVTNILEAAGKTVVEFSGIMANPTYAKVLEGAKLAKKNDVSLLLGIGGGSVMDCCKAISIAARYDGDVWEDFWKRPGVFDFEPLPLGVIVTVAGTGSECNGGAVITNEELKIKTGRDYPQCNPKFALLDPTYTYSVRPPLSSHIDQEVMEQYDVIFVGFPIWWYDLPMPVWSFLEEYDLSGKTIIPFFTHNGSSSGASSISTVAELCPDSTVLTDDYFTYSGNNVDEAESAVDEWLTELGYNN